jgi:large subunit ribosomal protein L19
MSHALLSKFEQKYRKAKIADVTSGDNVRVHQKIKEGAKERTQMFEGMVIRTRKPDSLQAVITVRRMASGVGVEKTFFMHSPNVVKVEVIKRSKVRRNYLSYIRERQGRAMRLADREFDRDAANLQDSATANSSKVSKEQEASEAPAAAKDTKAETKAAEPAEAKPEATDDKPVKEDKAAAKKAKAEEFRKNQEAKDK